MTVPGGGLTDECTRKAIEASDTDELVRIVDGYSEARDWQALVELRRRCDEAVTRGKQLWGVAEYVRYRLALDAPAEWAGPVVTEGPSRFTLGPLPEVAASTKSWAELEPYLEPTPERTMVANERVCRGEDLRGIDVGTPVLELPLRLEAWEPAYPLATYKPDRVEAPSPPRPSFRLEQLDDSSGDVIEDTEATSALVGVVEHWVTTSNGRAQAVCVEGSVRTAVAALGVRRAGIEEVKPADALAWIGWAGASGGAHARRRGTAVGRFSAWWAAHEIAGLDWPVDPDELGARISELHWYLWTDGSPDTGWILQVAVESPAEGLAWALSAVDAE